MTLVRPLPMVLVAALLGACAPSESPESGWAPNAVELAMPPAAIDVTPLQAAVRGEGLTLRVQLPVPLAGIRVNLPITDGGIGPGICPPVLVGECLGIVGALDTPLASGFTDATGAVDIFYTVPASHPTALLGVQAVVLAPNNVYLSPPLALDVTDPVVDSDGDGYPVELDCDDNDPNSTILSNDADCDGTVTRLDCDDNDPGSTIVATDADCDGTTTRFDCDDNDPRSTTVATDADCDGTTARFDCDDNDARSTTVFTDADCDGTITSLDCDDNEPRSTTVATDGDCDGTLTAFDCDDNDPRSTTVFNDADCDGYQSAFDCDDNDPDSLTTSQDGDCDGTLTADDCDDNDPNSTIRAEDLACDGEIDRAPRRGSNTQTTLPRNQTLADVDGDGVTDLLQFAENRIFAYRNDYERTGILHHYLKKAISRLITGEFNDNGRPDVCAVQTDGGMRCYEISPDGTELWWWFSQGSIIANDEDAIVADFDGDGRDEVLVYSRTGDDYRMLEVSGGFFFEEKQAFNQGNLSSSLGAGYQVRAGHLDNNGRADLVVVNPWGQVKRYSSVFDGTNDTFWWSFTSAAFVGPDDQVLLARADDDTIDDLVLHDRTTGATRLYRVEYNGGTPPLISNASVGQIDTTPDTELSFARLHTSTSEQGSINREDALTYRTLTGQFHKASARYSATAGLTWWWAFTNNSPRNHSGWAPREDDSWLMLKCKFSDYPNDHQTDDYYQDLMFGREGVVDYWREITYGSWNLDTTVVDDTWYTMSTNQADWQSNLSRWDRVGACIDAYGGSTSGFVNVIAMVNGPGDAGNQGGRVLGNDTFFNATFLAHEMGHTYGWGHSFDDTTRQAATWSQPGEYYDKWDIMSAMNVFQFTNLEGIGAGPDMNSVLKDEQALIPWHRMRTLLPGTSTQTTRLDLAAITRPEGNGYLSVRVGADNDDYLVLEYRMTDGYDAGIPRDTVLVRRVLAGRSILLTGGGTERTVGETSSHVLGGSTVTLEVLGFADEGFTAEIELTY